MAEPRHSGRSDYGAAQYAGLIEGCQELTPDIVFIGKTQSPSFRIAAIERSLGLQLFPSIPSLAMSERSFHCSTFPNNLFAAIITKHWNQKTVQRARKVSRLVAYQPIDKTGYYPSQVDAYLVNTASHKQFLYSLGTTKPVIVLPQHHSNFNNIQAHTRSLTNPRRLLYTGEGNVGSRNAIQQWLTRHGLQWNEIIDSVPPMPRRRDQPIRASMHLAEQHLNHRVIFASSYSIRENRCFKPGQRFFLACSVDVTTVIEPVEAFLEALTHASSIPYPLQVSTSLSTSDALDRAYNMSASTLSITRNFIARAYSLPHLSWLLSDILTALAHNSSISNPYETAIVLAECQPSFLASHGNSDEKIQFL